MRDILETSSLSPELYSFRTSLEQWLQGHIDSINDYCFFSHFVCESFELDLLAVTKLFPLHAFISHEALYFCLCASLNNQLYRWAFIELSCFPLLWHLNKSAAK